MKKARLLVLSSFPAPYRVEIFKKLKTVYENMDIFFQYAVDSNRNKDFYSTTDEVTFFILGCFKADNYLKECVSNLEKYSLIVAYDWYLPYAVKILLKAIRLNVPYIVNCDGAFLPAKKTAKQVIKDLVKRVIISSAGCCFASGKYAKEYFLYYGAKEENIVIHHFTSLKEIDIRKTVVSKEEKHQLRNNLQIKNRKMVISVGQFIYRKGFDILLSAWGDLDYENQLVILGGGEQEEEYKKYIEKCGYKNVFLHGYMPKEKIFQFYCAADLFVLPTREDIWGLVINEAMACGLPVITTDRCIAGLECIQNGINGFIIPTENSKMLHDSMKYLLVDDDRREKMGALGLEKISEYTMENVVESHLRCIDRLLNDINTD